MSYDLMVFAPEAAPAGRDAFLAWYNAQTQSEDGHDYNDPSVLTPALRACFDEMREEFPPMNGPFRSQDYDNPCLTDYSLSRTAIYACFAWSEAEDARRTTFHYAKLHGLGFFDVSADNGGVWLPTREGTYECVHGGT